MPKFTIAEKNRLNNDSKISLVNCNSLIEAKRLSQINQLSTHCDVIIYDSEGCVIAWSYNWEKWYPYTTITKNQ